MFASRSQKPVADQSRPIAVHRGSGALRRIALIALTAALPVAAALSQGGVAAQAALPSTIEGTWAMLQVSNTKALTFFTPTINAALAIPGVKGLSLRTPWTSITSNLDIYSQGVQIAQADHSQLAIRFIAGVDTPTADLGNSTTIAGKPIPLPWGAGSTPTSFIPNTTFENAYRTTVQELASFALANGIHLLHLSWYSGTTAEIYNGPEVIKAPGYSLSNFITGYERLAAIGMSVAGPNLTVEFPFGGVGTGSVVTPLEKYIATTYGSMNPEFMAQWNNLTDAIPAVDPPSNGVNVSRQMQGQGDYNWANVYQTLDAQGTQTVEVYLQSFASNLPHAAALRQQVAAFHG
jgi:hypothetical protein